MTDKDRIKMLQGELNDALMDRIKSEVYHSERMVEWVKAGAQNAVTAFTSGPQRNIAYAIEELIRDKNVKN